MTKRARENLVYCGISLGSIYFLLWVIPAYTPAYPGYGVPGSLLPNLAVGIILMLSLISLLNNFFAHRAEQKTEHVKTNVEINQEQKVHLWHLVKIMVPCVLLMPAMQRFGFIAAGLVFMLLMQYLCGQRSPVKALLVAVATVGALYAAMRYVLGVPMP